MSAMYVRSKTSKFSRQILVKFSKNKNFTQIHPVGADLFHPDGQTDMTKVIFALRNDFANTPKYECVSIWRRLSSEADSENASVKSRIC